MRLCYLFVIRGSVRHSVPRNGPQMLPNFKVVICAIMFAVLLFAVTGAGVVIPETYTRVGEMPEVGRPMMQRMITDEPGQTQFHTLSLTRRSGELDRLRARTFVEIETVSARTNEAEVVKQADVVKQSDIESPEPEIATVVAAPALLPSGAMGTVAAAPPRPADAEPPPAKSDEPPETAPPTPATEPLQLAAAPPITVNAKPLEPLPSTQAKVSPLRRIAKASALHRKSFHRSRLVRTHPTQTSFGQSWFSQPSFQSR
jgi:hypothetical protein